MTAQLLTSELQSLIQESKRKNQDLRNAAEKSLNDLKAFTNNTEAQVAADLNSRPDFVTPFLLACHTRNPKFAGSGILCLQRLIVSGALSDASIKETLEALRECSSLALDIQLKVLQALPSLLQNYFVSLKGRLLVSTFEVCFLLYGSKTAAVSNTAAATLQQLVALTFDKVVTEDRQLSDFGLLMDLTIDDDTISLREGASDAYKLLKDICLLAEGKKPTFLLTATLSQNFGLELIESILTDYAGTIANHPELLYICRSCMIPFVMRLISERATFPTTVRAMRLVPLFFGGLLFELVPECEMILSLLNHILDPDNAVLWKRVLCLELFRGIYSDSALVRSLYSHFDEQHEKRNIVGDHLAILVRLASEKPTVIGLGQKSTSSSHSRDSSVEQATVQADSLIGSIGVTVTVTESDAPGISTRWSTLRIPCIEQLDKSEAPTLPAAYIYSLALTCVTSFSEGLAKFLLPFTLPTEAKGKRKSRANEDDDQNDGFSQEDRRKANAAKPQLLRSQSMRSRKSPINPLNLKGHELYGQICTSGHMVEHCWPALLATYSTFLNATLDSENYHALVRSFQRFTQVAGLLDLSTPRDAFLTTLGKHSLPLTSPNALAIGSSKVFPSMGGSESPVIADKEPDANSSPNFASGRQRQHTDSGSVSISTRNLLCLRALLNLGIALGPLLQKSWLIILETLQHADFMLLHFETTRRQTTSHLKQNSGGVSASDDSGDTGEHALEIAAAKTAATRMFESTSELPDLAFMDILKCLFSLVRNIQIHSTEYLEVINEDLPSPQLAAGKHSRLLNLPHVSNDGASVIRGNMFVFTRLGEIINCNISRLQRRESGENGWDFVTEMLVNSLSIKGFSTEIRVEAADNLNRLILAVATSQDHRSQDERDEIRKRGLVALLKSISSLYNEDRSGSKIAQSCDGEIHRLSLETLRSVLEHCGDSLGLGWDKVFAIIISVFAKSVSGDHMDHDDDDNDDDDDDANHYTPRSPKLLQSSFGSLQLICSDFLVSVPHSCLLTLLDTLYAFSCQDQDLNVSLTTVTFFRNVSDFLLLESNRLEFDASITRSKSENDLIRLIKGERRSVSVTALWLCLLLRLMRLANDEKMEVRHSVLRTLFSIFDTADDQLNPAAWHMCYRTIIFEMLNANEVNYKGNQSLGSSQRNDMNMARWTETAIIMVGGVSKLFMQTFIRITAGGYFPEIWNQLLKPFKALLDRESLDLSAAVYVAITKMLAGIEETKKVGKSSINLVWNIWKDSNPVLRSDKPTGTNDNQECLIAYLDWLHQIYRLVGSEMQLEQVRTITQRLHSIVIGSKAAAYSADLDLMTQVQRHVLESLKKMPAEAPGAFTEIIKSLIGFVCLAYENGAVKKGQTYVALSKSAMDLLYSGITDYVGRGQTVDPVLLTQAVAALKIPIRLKYKWHLEGKEPKTWRKATTTALAILESCIPKVASLQDNAAFWDTVVDINDGIIAADCESCPNPSDIPQDEDFDIEAYSRLRQLLIPGIGSQTNSDPIRLKYAKSLFNHSIVHAPHPEDLARPGQDLLLGLQSVHIGRTQRLPPHPRSKLCYVLLDELFNLVSIQDGSRDRLKLAQVAGPFLILRAGITIKAYVYDQPLRGRMPQPRSQKQELLLILQKLRELNSEPGAIADSTGILSAHKKHLHRLYSLLVRATEAAWRDDEVTGAVRRILITIGQDFEVCTGRLDSD